MVGKSMRMALLHEVQSESERAKCGDAAGDRDQRLLRLALPADELDEEQPQAAREMCREREHDRDLACRNPWRARPGEEIVEAVDAVERARQGEEMQGKEQRERKPGDAVDEKRPVRRVTAI